MIELAHLRPPIERQLGHPLLGSIRAPGIELTALFTILEQAVQITDEFDVSA